jgi:hypothetical protein
MLAAQIVQIAASAMLKASPGKDSRAGIVSSSQASPRSMTDPAIR